MKKEELRNRLLACITGQEWHGLEQGDETLRISGFNREVLLRMRENRTGMDGDIPDDFAESPYAALDHYLREYMADCPAGHKWIILACIYLSCVEGVPMHPQDAVRWVQYAGEYFCPYHSGENSVCRYCVCKKKSVLAGGLD